MTDNDRQKWFRQAAREVLLRNPPPPASAALIGKLRAIFAKAEAPDNTAAGPAPGPAAAADSPPAKEARRAHSTTAA